MKVELTQVFYFHTLVYAWRPTSNDMYEVKLRAKKWTKKEGKKPKTTLIKLFGCEESVPGLPATTIAK
jgi:hypothetical protein